MAEGTPRSALEGTVQAGTTEETPKNLPEGCIYYGRDKLKNKLRCNSKDPWGGVCLYISNWPTGKKLTSELEEKEGGWNLRICEESHGNYVKKPLEDNVVNEYNVVNGGSVVKDGIAELTGHEVKLLRIYNGLDLSKYLDAKEEGILEKSLKDIDKYFVEPEFLKRQKK